MLSNEEEPDKFDEVPANVALNIVHDDVRIEGIVIEAVVPANAQLIVTRHDPLTTKHRRRAYIHLSHLGSNMKMTALDQSQGTPRNSPQLPSNTSTTSPVPIRPELPTPSLLEAYDANIGNELTSIGRRMNPSSEEEQDEYDIAMLGMPPGTSMEPKVGDEEYHIAVTSNTF